MPKRLEFLVVGVLLVGLVTGSILVQRKTTPLPSLASGCRCVDDGVCSAGENTVPNIKCDGNRNGFGTACCGNAPAESAPPTTSCDPNQQSSAHGNAGCGDAGQGYCTRCNGNQVEYFCKRTAVASGAGCIAPASQQSTGETSQTAANWQKCNPDKEGTRYGVCSNASTKACGSDFRETKCVNNHWESTGNCCQTPGDIAPPSSVTTVTTTSTESTQTASPKAQTARASGKCDTNLGLCPAIDPKTGEVTGWIPATTPVFCDYSCALAARMNVVAGSGYSEITVGGTKYQAYNLNVTDKKDPLTGIDSAAVKKAAAANQVTVDANGFANPNLTAAQAADLQKRVDAFSKEQNAVQQAIVNDLNSKSLSLTSACTNSTNLNVCLQTKYDNFKYLSQENQTQVTAGIQSTIRVNAIVAELQKNSGTFPSVGYVKSESVLDAGTSNVNTFSFPAGTTQDEINRAKQIYAQQTAYTQITGEESRRLQQECYTQDNDKACLQWNQQFSQYTSSLTPEQLSQAKVQNAASIAANNQSQKDKIFTNAGLNANQTKDALDQYNLQIKAQQLANKYQTGQTLTPEEITQISQYYDINKLNEARSQNLVNQAFINIINYPEQDKKFRDELSGSEIATLNKKLQGYQSLQSQFNTCTANCPALAQNFKTYGYSDADIQKMLDNKMAQNALTYNLSVTNTQSPDRAEGNRAKVVTNLSSDQKTIYNNLNTQVQIQNLLTTPTVSSAEIINYCHQNKISGCQTTDNIYQARDLLATAVTDPSAKQQLLAYNQSLQQGKFYEIQAQSAEFIQNQNKIIKTGTTSSQCRGSTLHYETVNTSGLTLTQNTICQYGCNAGVCLTQPSLAQQQILDQYSTIFQRQGEHGITTADSALQFALATCTSNVPQAAIQSCVNNQPLFEWQAYQTITKPGIGNPYISLFPDPASRKHLEELVVSGQTKPSDIIAKTALAGAGGGIGQLAVGLNTISGGKVLVGNQILNSGLATGNTWDIIRGAVIQGYVPAQLAVTAVAPFVAGSLALIPGSLIGAGLANATTVTATNIISTTVATNFAISSTAHTSEVCPFNGTTDAWQCGLSIANTALAYAFLPVSALSGNAQIQSALGTQYALALKTESAIKYQTDAILSSAQAATPLVKYGAPFVFGANTIDSCIIHNTSATNCATNFGMLMLSGRQLFTSPEIQSSGLLKTTDVGVNTAILATGCSAYLSGQSDITGCLNAAGFAFGSYTHALTPEEPQVTATTRSPDVILTEINQTRQRNLDASALESEYRSAITRQAVLQAADIAAKQPSLSKLFTQTKNSIVLDQSIISPNTKVTLSDGAVKKLGDLPKGEILPIIKDPQQSRELAKQGMQVNRGETVILKDPTQEFAYTFVDANGQTISTRIGSTETVRSYPILDQIAGLFGVKSSAQMADEANLNNATSVTTGTPRTADPKSLTGNLLLLPERVGGNAPDVIDNLQPGGHAILNGDTLVYRKYTNSELTLQPLMSTTTLDQISALEIANPAQFGVGTLASLPTQLFEQAQTTTAKQTGLKPAPILTDISETGKEIANTYKPNSCSNCSLEYTKFTDLLKSAKDASTPEEQITTLIQAGQVVADHFENNQPVYASARISSEAQIFSTFGVNREELLTSLKDGLELVQDTAKQNTDLSTTWRLNDLETYIKDTIVRFDPTLSDIFENRTPEALEYKKFIYFITGIWLEPGNEYKLAQRMQEDSLIVRQKYNLPPRQLKIDQPAEYINQLKAIAQKEGVSVRSGIEFQKFFEKYPNAAAVYFDHGNTIVIPQRDANNYKDMLKFAGDLEHELTHALQNKRYPGMPIEIREYEAYAVNRSPTYLENNPLNAIDISFSFFIRGSVNHWYKDQEIISKPWDSVKLPTNNSILLAPLGESLMSNPILAPIIAPIAMLQAVDPILQANWPDHPFSVAWHNVTTGNWSQIWQDLTSPLNPTPPAPLTLLNTLVVKPFVYNYRPPQIPKHTNTNYQPFGSIIDQAISQYQNSTGKPVYWPQNKQFSLSDFISTLFTPLSPETQLNHAQLMNDAQKKSRTEFESLIGLWITNRDPSSNLGDLLSKTRIILYASLPPQIKDIVTNAYDDSFNNYKLERIYQKAKVWIETTSPNSPMSSATILSHFIEQNSGNLSLSLDNLSGFLRWIARSTGSDSYIWMRNHITDEFSPNVSFNSFPSSEEYPYTGPFGSKVSLNSRLNYDYSLLKQVGKPYHSAHIVSLLSSQSPGSIAFMVFGEYILHGREHGLEQFISDMYLLADLSKINKSLKTLPSNAHPPINIPPQTTSFQSNTGPAPTLSGPGQTLRQVRYDSQSGKVYELSGTEITNLAPNVVLDDGKSPLILQNGTWAPLQEGTGGGGEEKTPSLSQPNLDSKNLLESIIQQIPENKLRKGVYTEIHQTSDGQIYVTPEIVDGSVHFASVNGYHSMWETGGTDLYRQYPEIRDHINTLQLSSKTIIAKGKLFKNEEGETNLVLIELRGDSDEIAKRIASTRNSLGLDKVFYTEKQTNVELTYSSLPKINSGDVYVIDLKPPSNESPTDLINGVIEMNYYDEMGPQFRNQSDSSTTNIQPITQLSFDIYQSKIRLHTELLNLLAQSDSYPGEHARKNVSEETINKHVYQIQGRHTFDPSNKSVQINLIITSPENRPLNREELIRFEHAYYFTYLREIVKYVLDIEKISPEELAHYKFKLSTSHTQGSKTVYLNANPNMGGNIPLLESKFSPILYDLLSNRDVADPSIYKEITPPQSFPTLGIVFNPFDPNFPLAKAADWIGQNITIPLQIRLGIRYEDSLGNLHWKLPRWQPVNQTINTDEHSGQVLIANTQLQYELNNDDTGMRIYHDPSNTDLFTNVTPNIPNQISINGRNYLISVSPGTKPGTLTFSSKLFLKNPISLRSLSSFLNQTKTSIVFRLGLPIRIDLAQKRKGIIPVNNSYLQYELTNANKVIITNVSDDKVSILSPEWPTTTMIVDNRNVRFHASYDRNGNASSLDYSTNNWWLSLLGLLGLAFNGPACNQPTYTVWPGDNLTKIARRCNMTLEELIKLNHISDPNNIQIGQILTVSPNYQSPVQSPVAQGNNLNLREQNQALIEDIADKYHVPGQYLDAIWGVESNWRIQDYAYCQQQCNSNQSCGPMQITPPTQRYVDPQMTQDICTLRGAMEIAARILLWKKYCLVSSISQPACAKISAGDFTGMSLEMNRNINIYNLDGRPLSPLIAVGRYNGNDCYPFSSSIYRWGIKPDGSGYTYCDAVQHIIDGDPLPENMGSQRTQYDPVAKCVNAMYAEKDLEKRKHVDCSYLDGFQNRPPGWWTHLIDSSITPADTANLLPPDSSQP